MIQTAKRLEGKLTPCPSCNGQPTHIHCRGPGKHFLECCPCQVRTPRYDSLQEAVEAWERSALMPVAANVTPIRRRA